MTQNEVIAMAKQAGLLQDWMVPYEGEIDGLQRFWELAAAKERDACAQLCEDVSLQAATSWKLAYQPQDQGRETGADDCAAAIRARGDAS